MVFVFIYTKTLKNEKFAISVIPFRILKNFKFRYSRTKKKIRVNVSLNNELAFLNHSIKLLTVSISIF